MRDAGTIPKRMRYFFGHTLEEMLPQAERCVAYWKDGIDEATTDEYPHNNPHSGYYRHSTSVACHE